ncbi:hypothetical protein AX16_010787 [Volvariella volvacea WC 439]|nr:hypothetical protein AX16_010787 [Volvariella volvacea WC 439]
MSHEAFNGFTSPATPYPDTEPIGMGGYNNDAEMLPPLSAKEQEIFHELCVSPDWDKEATNGRDTITEIVTPDSILAQLLQLSADSLNMLRDGILDEQAVHGLVKELQLSPEVLPTLIDLPPPSPLTDVSSSSPASSPRLPSVEPSLALPPPASSSSPDPATQRIRSKAPEVAAHKRMTRSKQPLHRSKQVAEAITAQSQTRSRCHGSGNSLS